MANVIFLSDCGDSTGDLSEFSSPTNNVSTQATTVHTGSRAIKITYAAASGNFDITGVLADTGRRISFYFQTSGTPSTTFRIAISAGQWELDLTTARKLSVAGGATTSTGTTSLNTGQWYRITISYVTTSTTVNDVKVFLDDATTAECSVHNATYSSTGGTLLELGNVSNAADTVNHFFDDIYIDNGTTLDNPSTNGLRVTRKAPNANGTNNAFDTAIGSVTNRWDAVNELPVSTGKGWQQVGSSQVIEAYGIQSASQGDVDITGATILGYKAWISARGQLVTDGTPKTTASNNAKATGTTLALGPVTVAAGDIIVALFGDQVGGSAPTIADNIGGNTWTALTGPNTNTARISKWYCIVTNGGSMTATVTFGSSANARAGVLGVWDASAFAASPLDKDIANANDSTSPYDCPATGTLAQADEIVLGFCSRASNAALSAGGSELGIIEGHSTGGSAGTNISVGLTYRKVTATTSIQPQMTGSSVAGVVGTASFKITPITAGTPKLVDNGSDVAITLSSTQTLYSNHTTTSTYPANGNTIGMKSSGSAMDSFLYECGIQIAYIPASSTPLTLAVTDDINA